MDAEEPPAGFGSSTAALGDTDATANGADAIAMSPVLQPGKQPASPLKGTTGAAAAATAAPAAAAPVVDLLGGDDDLVYGNGKQRVVASSSRIRIGDSPCGPFSAVSRGEMLLVSSCCLHTVPCTVVASQSHVPPVQSDVLSGIGRTLKLASHVC